MSLTDQQIYEMKPEIKALNDEWVALGAQLRELEPKLLAAHDALATANEAARAAIDAAKLAVQKAQAELAAVQAAEAGKINAATRTLSMLRDDVQALTNRRDAVQRHHNEAISDAQAEHAAQQALAQG